MLGLKIIILFFISAQIRTQCCLRFQGNRCVSCPTGTHLYRGSCLNDIDNCAQYRDGFDCQKCFNGYQLNLNGQCILKAPPQSPSNEFTDTLIDFQQLKDPVPPILSKSLDYLLSTKPVLKNLKVLTGSVRSYKNGTNQVSLQFRDKGNYFKSVLTTNQQGTFFSESAFNQVISPTILSNSSVPPATSLFNIDLNNQVTGSADAIINSGIKQINDFISSATNTLNYVVVDNPQADQNYQIISDFIGFVQPQFAKFQPIKVMRAFDNQVSYFYKLTYVVADGSSWQLSAKLDTNTYVATFQTKIQLSGPSKPNSPTLTKIQLNKIYEDMYFIMVYDSINKQFNNKYSESVIRSADMSEDASSVRYIINFQQSGFVWEVICQINKATFTVNGIQQTRKQSMSPTTDSGPALVTTNPSPINSVNPIPPVNPNPVVNPTPSNPNPAVIPPVNPIVNPTPPINPPTPPINPPTPPINPNLQTNPVVNPNPRPFNPPGNPNISTPANPPPFNPVTTSPQTISKATSLPDRILASVGKMTQVAASDFSSGEFKQMDMLIRQINSKQLSNGQLIGIFYSSTSFSRNYLVYYQKGPQIYEARVSRDMIRKRNYVIGFNKV